MRIECLSTTKSSIVLRHDCSDVIFFVCGFHPISYSICLWMARGNVNMLAILPSLHCFMRDNCGDDVLTSSNAKIHYLWNLQGILQ